MSIEVHVCVRIMRGRKHTDTHKGGKTALGVSVVYSDYNIGEIDFFS